MTIISTSSGTIYTLREDAREITRVAPVNIYAPPEADPIMAAWPNGEWLTYGEADLIERDRGLALRVLGLPEPLNSILSSEIVEVS